MAHLINADNPHHMLILTAVAVAHRCPKKYLLMIGLAVRIDNLGDFNTFEQMTHAAINLPQPLFAVDVVTIFRAITIACGPRNNLDNFRPFNRAQLL